MRFLRACLQHREKALRGALRLPVLLAWVLLPIEYGTLGVAAVVGSQDLLAIVLLWLLLSGSIASWWCFSEQFPSAGSKAELGVRAGQAGASTTTQHRSNKRDPGQDIAQAVPVGAQRCPSRGYYWAERYHPASAGSAAWQRSGEDNQPVRHHTLVPAVHTDSEGDDLR